jgi:hypothetical protein
MKKLPGYVKMKGPQLEASGVIETAGKSGQSLCGEQ